MHICINNLTIIGSDDGLAPGQCQAITWTNARMLLIEPLGTNCNEILIYILSQENASENVVRKMAAIFSQLNVLSKQHIYWNLYSWFSWYTSWFIMKYNFLFGSIAW